ncbi:anoctamin-10 isoform X1 [Microcaecilia unicolor]|uniref:Anoctamin n=1 Tax=Microcaecilia unicolor TaxID=1415580 RepID=A0A6P7Y8T0_9AMPH|nr:anoctamin-10-like isoform X1 [Microcaecilia unicolor]XP_030059500.1 anoctamin-10-like isoform X1 [Microcaecilia unicolor]
MSSWTPVPCQCCYTSCIQSLVAIQLRYPAKAETKRWLISKLEGHKKEGGAHLLVHPGEDDDGTLILLSATPYTLLKATEVLGLAKPSSDGSMVAFSYNNKADFPNSDKPEAFLTLAERQLLVKYATDSAKVLQETPVPGYPERRLYPGQSIVQSLQEWGIIEKFYPLHVEEELHLLTRAWYSQIHRIGQPIDAIRAYFGDSVALYFSFLGFFTISLVPMAILGAVYHCLSLSFLDKYLLFAVFSVLWSTMTMEFWKRHCATKAYVWGTLHLKSRFEAPRARYWGPSALNPVTGRWEPYYPSWKRKLRIMLVSIPTVFVFLGLAFDGMIMYLYWERWVQASYQQSRGSGRLAAVCLYLPSCIYTLYIELLNVIYKRAATILTEWENHRAESTFQNQLTVKVLVFRFINCFSGLFYITFYMQDLQLLQKRLSSLLIISQVINQFKECLLPLLLQKLQQQPGASHRKNCKDAPVVDSFVSEGNLSAYPGLFDDYMELFVQFGYASLFSCVYPLTAALLVVNNITEIWTDSFKLCRLFQKPFPCPAANIGVWQVAFEVLGIFAVGTNCFIITISPEVKEFCQDFGMTPEQSLLYAIGLEHILVTLKIVLAFAIPDQPHWLRIKVMQMEYHSWDALKQAEIKRALPIC